MTPVTNHTSQFTWAQQYGNQAQATVNALDAIANMTLPQRSGNEKRRVFSRLDTSTETVPDSPNKKPKNEPLDLECKENETGISENGSRLTREEEISLAERMGIQANTLHQLVMARNILRKTPGVDSKILKAVDRAISLFDK